MVKNSNKISSDFKQSHGTYLQMKHFAAFALDSPQSQMGHTHLLTTALQMIYLNLSKIQHFSGVAERWGHVPLTFK